MYLLYQSPIQAIFKMKYDAKFFVDNYTKSMLKLPKYLTYKKCMIMMSDDNVTIFSFIGKPELNWKEVSK